MKRALQLFYMNEFGFMVFFLEVDLRPKVHYFIRDKINGKNKLLIKKYIKYLKLCKLHIYNYTNCIYYLSDIFFLNETKSTKKSVYLINFSLNREHI